VDREAVKGSTKLEKIAWLMFGYVLCIVSASAYTTTDSSRAADAFCYGDRSTGDLASGEHHCDSAASG